MKISTWNVNSIRARIENIKKYLKVSAPDIVLLQEIKTEECNYPFSDIKELGYTSYVNGQKSYNGVAILSKHTIQDIKKSLYENNKDDLATFLSLIFMANDVLESSKKIFTGNYIKKYTRY